MRVFWWQGGLHVEPETDEQRQLIDGLWRVLSDGVRIGHEVVTGPVGAVEINHEEPVVRVDELL